MQMAIAPICTKQAHHTTTYGLMLLQAVAHCGHSNPAGLPCFFYGDPERFHYAVTLFWKSVRPNCFMLRFRMRHIWQFCKKTWTDSLFIIIMKKFVGMRVGCGQTQVAALANKKITWEKLWSDKLWCIQYWGLP